MPVVLFGAALVIGLLARSSTPRRPAVRPMTPLELALAEALIAWRPSGPAN